MQKNPVREWNKLAGELLSGGFDELETHATIASERFAAVILAAGQSKRFKSRRTKILHELWGKAIIEYVVEALERAGASPILLVVSPGMRTEVSALLGGRVQVVVQHPPLGTGHALQQTEAALRDFSGDLCLVVGDCPLITPEFLLSLYRSHRQQGNDATITSVVFASPPPYGRVVRDRQGRLQAIVEEKEATPEQRKIKEVSTSHYFLRAPLIFHYLKQITNDNAQGEYYLPDAINLMLRDGRSVGVFRWEEPLTLMGINTRQEFQQVSNYLKQRIQEAHMQNGVTILDPATTVIEPEVQIGRDTVIYPFTYLKRGVRIGEECRIGPFVYLKAGQIPDRTIVETNTERKHGQEG